MLGVIFWLCILFVVYVYVGYPVLIGLLAKFAKPSNLTFDYRPTVTLLFAAHNEERVIVEKLENCLSLNYPRELLQILVVDDGSVDQTPELVRSFADRGVELISFPQRRGKLAAQKDSLKNVRGEIILFSDADNFYPPDTLLALAKYFSDPLVGCVSGGRNVIGDTHLGQSEGLYWKYEEFIKRQESRLGSCIGVAGDLVAVRKDLFVSPPEGIINDDFYTGISIIKLGYRVVYAPDARSYHPVANTAQGEIERRARMVAGRYQFMFLAWRILPWRKPLVVWQIISHKLCRPFVPLAMITAFFASLLAVLLNESVNGPAWLVLASPYQTLILVLQLVFYGFAWVGSRYQFRGILGKALYVPTFLVNSNWAALRGLYRYATSSQTVVWKKGR